MRTSLRSLAVVGVAIALTATIAAAPDDRTAAPVADVLALADDVRTARAHAAVGDPTTRRPVAPVAAVRDAAIAAVEADAGVLLADGRRCAAEDLEVSYVHPGAGWTSGAWVGELGPTPTKDTTAVNGIVRCDGSLYAFVGFEAVRDGDAWSIGLVPDPHTGEDGHEHEPDPDAPERPAPVGAAAQPPAPGLGLVGRGTGPTIEGYARYEPQTTCSGSAQVGSVALRDLLLRTYPGTRSLGIVRGCSVGGRSEHKEGRAFDWGALVGRAAEKAAADDFLARLTATDAYGNRHALARRMGVMYAIWNGRIWSAYNADAGWRAYNGSSPHTDHVHISLSWAGARGETSFWTGQVVEGLPTAPVGGGASSGAAAPVATTTDRDRAGERDRGAASPSDGTTPRHGRREREEAARAEAAAEDAARREREEAEDRARREAEAVDRAEEEARRERDRVEREARKQVEREARGPRKGGADEVSSATVPAGGRGGGGDRSDDGGGKGKAKGKGR